MWRPTRGRIGASVVVDAAGAWAPELARTVGLEVPVQPWRHDTAYLGLPEGRDASFPIVLDHGRQVYFRPEGHEQMLAGLETANELGGSPDRPFRPIDADVSAELVSRVCQRVPWMASGSLRGAFAGQDGMTPDQRPIVDRAGPDGFYLLCGFSGTGFKTAPAVGAGLADWILDGGPPHADSRRSHCGDSPTVHRSSGRTRTATSGSRRGGVPAGHSGRRPGAADRWSAGSACRDDLERLQRLDGHHDADREDESSGEHRHGTGQAGGDTRASEADDRPTTDDDRDADAREDERHPEPEGERQHDPELRPPDRHRARAPG